MTAARAVLFDLDGVLVESYEVWFHLLAAAAREWGYPDVGRAAFDASWGQGVAADVRTFYPRHTVEQVAAYYDGRFLDHAAHLRFEPAAPAVLAALADRGVRTAVVSNTPGPLVRAILARGGLVVETVVGGTDVPRPKPAPDIVLEALRRLDVASDEALLVGDTRFDREAAAGAGVRFVGLGTDGDDRVERLADLLPLVVRAS